MNKLQMISYFSTFGAIKAEGVSNANLDLQKKLINKQVAGQRSGGPIKE